MMARHDELRQYAPGKIDRVDKEARYGLNNELAWIWIEMKHEQEIDQYIAENLHNAARLVESRERRIAQEI